MAADYVSPEEMAAIHGVDKMTILRALWEDQKRPEDQRRIPGAVKVGSKYRGEWRIPRDTAEAWQRDPRGRKSVE